MCFIRTVTTRYLATVLQIIFSGCCAKFQGEQNDGGRKHFAANRIQQCDNAVRLIVIYLQLPGGRTLICFSSTVSLRSTVYC